MKHIAIREKDYYVEFHPPFTQAMAQMANRNVSFASRNICKQWLNDYFPNWRQQIVKETNFL